MSSSFTLRFYHKKTLSLNSLTNCLRSYEKKKNHCSILFICERYFFHKSIRTKSWIDTSKLHFSWTQNVLFFLSLLQTVSQTNTNSVLVHINHPLTLGTILLFPYIKRLSNLLNRVPPSPPAVVLLALYDNQHHIISPALPGDTLGDVVSALPPHATPSLATRPLVPRDDTQRRHDMARHGIPRRGKENIKLREIEKETNCREMTREGTEQQIEAMTQQHRTKPYKINWQR